MSDNATAYHVRLKPASKSIEMFANILRPGPGEKSIVVGLKALSALGEEVELRGPGVSYSAALSQQFLYLPGQLPQGTARLPRVSSEVAVETLEVTFQPWLSDIDVSNLFGDVYVSVGTPKDATISLSRGTRKEMRRG